jgi:hypothetical protein
MEPTFNFGNLGASPLALNLASLGGVGGLSMGSAYSGAAPSAGFSMGAPAPALRTGAVTNPGMTYGAIGGGSLRAGAANPRRGGGEAPAGAGAGGGGFFKGIGGLEGIATIADGLASLGQLYGAFQGVKLAKEQLGLQREAYQTNLANQRQSYNTALEDRINTRHVMEGRGSAETEAYLAKNRL